MIGCHDIDLIAPCVDPIMVEFTLLNVSSSYLFKRAYNYMAMVPKAVINNGLECILVFESDLFEATLVN
jgi:hypothetical protein